MVFKILGREDSNLRMAVPKTAALPLGDAPSYLNYYYILYNNLFLFFCQFFYVSEREGFEPSVQIICTTD